MMATLQLLVKNGLAGDPEESLHFKKIFWLFAEKFHSQAILLFMELDLRQGQISDGEDIQEPAVPHDDEGVKEEDVPHDGEDLIEPDVPHVEDLGSYQGAFSEISVIKGSGYSKVLKAKMGEKDVALRIIKAEERDRAHREIEAAKDVKHFHHLTVPLLFPAHLPNKSLLVMEFYPENLKMFLRSKESRKLAMLDKDLAVLDKVVHRLLQGIAILHSLNIVHSDLTPEHIFVCQRMEKMTVLIGNFERSTVDGGVPMYQPTTKWAPDSELHSKSTKATDVYTLGMLLLFIWTGIEPVTQGSESDPPNNERIRITEDINFSKFKLDPKRISILESMICDSDWQEQAKDLCFYRAFWKKGSLPYYMERIYELMKRLGGKKTDPFKMKKKPKSEQMDWTKKVPEELMEEMTKHVQKLRNDAKSPDATASSKPAYENTVYDFIRFCRNLAIHRKTIKEAQTFQSDEAMEEFLLENFREVIETVQTQCSPKLDNIFKREFAGYLITPWEFDIVD